MIENAKENNEILLCGKFLGTPEFSHKVKDEEFYTCVICVSRLSGYEDQLLVTLPARINKSIILSKGNYFKIFGQLRTYNKYNNSSNKLVLTVFASSVEPLDICNNINSISLNGYICKEPIFRTTPFNREICDILFAVNRGHNKSDYIPCICWGNNAKACAELKVGSEISISGRMQSRIYNKKLPNGVCEKRTAYEVSVSSIKNINLNNNKKASITVV